MVRVLNEQASGVEQAAQFEHAASGEQDFFMQVRGVNLRLFYKNNFFIRGPFHREKL